jgi:hypothetical protein
MARRETERPTVNEDGYERHPAWGLIGASRVSSGGGASLFDSDIPHREFVVVRLSRASRRRNLNSDFKHGEEQLIEIAMSEAQWASFVSTMNVGQGVPCTIERIAMERMPGLEHEPRLAVSMDEVGNATTKAVEEIRAAFEAYEQNRTKANRDTLKYAIANAPANMKFAAKSLDQHAENVVQRARADVEAMVVHKAEQLGIDPGELADVRFLEAGGESEGQK